MLACLLPRRFARGVAFLLSVAGALPLSAQFTGFEADELGVFDRTRANLNGTDLNNRGDLVGFAIGSSGSPTVSFVYRDGAYTNLGTLTDGRSSYAYGINESGQITGYSFVRNGLNQTFASAFVYQDGTLTNVGIGLASRGLAINNAGTIAGLVQLDPGKREQGILIGTNPSSQTPVDGLDATANSRFLAINSRGDAVGFSGVSGSTIRPVLYTNGTLTDLGVPNGVSSEAIAINNAGTILIRNMTDPDLARKGYLFRDGTFTDIGHLGGNDTRPADLNAQGYVVGYSRQADGSVRGFVYTPDGGMQNLESLFQNNALVTAGYVPGSFSPFAINDNNQIAGIGTFTDAFGEHDRLMLLTPIAIPEPETYALILIGLAAAAASRRLRRKRR